MNLTNSIETVAAPINISAYSIKLILFTPFIIGDVICARQKIK